METTREPTSVDVVVVGAGLAGLAAAGTAARRGASTVVLDRAFGPSAGGRAATDERQAAGLTFLFNRGAHALYRTGPGAEVLARLGVTPRGAQPPIRSTMAAFAGDLHTFPVGPASLAATRLLGLRDKTRLGALLARLERMDPGSMAGTSVADWLDGAGVRGRAARVVEAALRTATFSVAWDLHDAGAAARQLQLAVDGGVLYLDGGWRQLVDALAAAARAAGAELRTGTVASGGIEPGRGRVLVRLQDGTALSAGAVVLAAGPPAAAARLLAGGPPAAWAAAGPEVLASCLDLGTTGPPRHRVVFGVDSPTYCSTHSPPAALAPDGGAVVSTIRYLAPGEELDAAAARSQLTKLAELAGVSPASVVAEHQLHRMVVAGGTPLAAAGGLAGRPGIDVGDGVLVAGDWVGSAGLLADAALASGEAAGRAGARRAAGLVAA